MLELSGKQQQRIFLANDIHAPYNDEYKCRIAYQICEDARPDLIILNGDIWDFYSVSAYSKSKERLKNGFQHEIDSGQAVIRSFQSAADVPTYMTIGNHEQRWAAYLRALDIGDMRALDFKNVIEADKLGLIVEADKIQIGKTIIFHGIYTGQAQNIPKKNLNVFGTGKHLITGHTHLTNVYTRNSLSGVTWAVEVGGLMDIEAVGAEYVKGLPNWSNAVAVIDIVQSQPFIQIIPIIGNGRYARSYFEGKEYVP